MTQFDDPLKQGQAYFQKAGLWATNNQYTAWFSGGAQVSGTYITETRGIPHSQTITYEAGTASTTLASGLFQNTSSQAAGTITLSGPLVTAGVGTFDVPRCIMITATGPTSTGVSFTFRGTDGYGQPLTTTLFGPSGGQAFGAAGSFVISQSAFKTITTASISAATPSGGVSIGNSDQYGMPYRLANTGKVLTANINGATASVAWTVNAGFSATGTPTATTADVRGTVLLASTNIANGSKNITFHFIAPTVGVSQANDTTANSYGVTPFTN